MWRFKASWNPDWSTGQTLRCQFLLVVRECRETKKFVSVFQNLIVQFQNLIVNCTGSSAHCCTVSFILREAALGWYESKIRGLALMQAAHFRTVRRARCLPCLHLSLQSRTRPSAPFFQWRFTTVKTWSCPKKDGLTTTQIIIILKKTTSNYYFIMQQEARAAKLLKAWESA